MRTSTPYILRTNDEVDEMLFFFSSPNEIIEEYTYAVMNQAINKGHRWCKLGGSKKEEEIG